MKNEEHPLANMPGFKLGLQHGQESRTSSCPFPAYSFDAECYRAGWVQAQHDKGLVFLADTGKEIVACQTIDEATDILDALENKARLAVA